MPQAEGAGFLIDMDGLLLDTEKLARQCWESVQETTGYRMPDGFYDSLIGLSLRAIEERLASVMPAACDVSALIGESEKAYDRALRAEAIPVKKGAKAFLQFLEKEGIPRCLVTSTFGELADWKLRSAGLASYLPSRVCGDDVQESKPSPDSYERAAALLHRRPSELIALEDSENGLRAALAAGCRVVHLPDLALVTPETRARVEAEYANLEELLGALFRGEIQMGKKKRSFPGRGHD